MINKKEKMGRKLFINTPELRSTVIEMSDGSLLEVRRGDETFRRSKQNERRIFANRAEWLRLVGGAEADVQTDGVATGGTEPTSDWAKMKKVYTDYGIKCNLIASTPLGQQLAACQKRLAYSAKYYGIGHHNHYIAGYKQQIDRLTTAIEQHGAGHVAHYSRCHGRPSDVQIVVADGRHVNFYLARDGMMEFDGKRGRTFAELGIPETPVVWVCCRKTGWNSEQSQAV